MVQACRVGLFFTPFDVYNKGILWTALQFKGELMGLKLANCDTAMAPLIFVEVFMKEVRSGGHRKNICETFLLTSSVQIKI
jgi:hypothetical protein